MPCVFLVVAVGRSRYGTGVAISDRALLLPEARAHRLTDWDLRQSLRNLGQTTPVLLYRGRLLDGGRRTQLCRALRLQVRATATDDRIEAARWLWAHHPRRAWLEFVEPGARRVAVAALFGCSLADLPSAEQLRDLRHTRTRITEGTDRQRLPSIICDRHIVQAAQRTCAQRGIKLSAAIRSLVEQLAKAET
jgi:hypothetical protein